jgi:hypothetical protein
MGLVATVASRSHGQLNRLGSRHEPVALRPEREDLLPLASAAHSAVEEHHWRPRAMLDNLDAAPQRRPECRGHRHSVDRVPAAPAGFLEKTKLLGRRVRRGNHGVKRCRRKTTTDRKLNRITHPR